MLNPRHILITGASSGIGAALAELYAGPGMRLSLHGRNATRLGAVAGRVREKGATVVAQGGDVTDGVALAAWIRTCDHLQPIDLVIANAGISAGTGAGRESGPQSRLREAQSSRGENEDQSRGFFRSMSAVCSIPFIPSYP